MQFRHFFPFSFKVEEVIFLPNVLKGACILINLFLRQKFEPFLLILYNIYCLNCISWETTLTFQMRANGNLNSKNKTQKLYKIYHSGAIFCCFLAYFMSPFSRAPFCKHFSKLSSEVEKVSKTNNKFGVDF